LSNRAIKQREKEREALAKKVAKGFRALKDIEEDVRRLWEEFDALADGETIMDCHTKTEYCEKVLGRTMRSVQYMLSGGNRRETVSRPSEAGEPDVLDVVYEKVSAFVCGEGASHPMQTLPVLVDALTKGRTLTFEEIETLDAIVGSLRQISEVANEYHYKLTALRPSEMAA